MGEEDSLDEEHAKRTTMKKVQDRMIIVDESEKIDVICD